MAKDYKYRVQGKDKKPPPRKKLARGLVKSMLVSGAIMAVVVVVLVLINSRLKKHTPPPPPVASTTNPESVKTNKPLESKMPEPTGPQFDFYTILPERDIVVPDYEIKTRAREEAIGKVNTKHYTMQAGSFKTSDEAEQLGAKLATMGIETTVQKAKVGNVTWYRVKLGPYTQMSSVSTLRTRLRQNGIDVVVTEVGN